MFIKGKECLMLPLYAQTNTFSKGYRKPQELSSSFMEQDQNSETKSYIGILAVSSIVSVTRGIDRTAGLILVTLGIISNI